MKKLIISAGFLALSACAYGNAAPEDLNLCADPPCTITPTHPWIDVNARERATEHDRINVKPEHFEPLAVCEIGDPATGGIDDIKCVIGAEWTYWPAGYSPSTPPVGGFACDLPAIAPIDGDQCYFSPMGLFGQVRHIQP